MRTSIHFIRQANLVLVMLFTAVMGGVAQTEGPWTFVDVHYGSRKMKRVLPNAFECAP